MESNVTRRWTRREVGCRWLILAAFLGGTVVVGCSTQRATQIQQPFVATKHKTVQIEPCEDRTGFKGKRDLTGEATRILTKKVRATNLFEVKKEAPLVLTCDIERFVEGSAVKRWVMPGWGATQAVIAVVVWEMPGEKVLATLRSQTSVESGGLYTIGANQYILSVVLDDIVKQLEAWAKVPGTG